MKEEEKPRVIDDYGDHEIQEYEDSKVPTFLKFVYVILPIWGLTTFYLFGNGSWGWLDRGYWQELQVAAGTTQGFEKVEFKLSPDTTQRVKTEPGNP